VAPVGERLCGLERVGVLVAKEGLEELVGLGDKDTGGVVVAVLFVEEPDVVRGAGRLGVLVAEEAALDLQVFEGVLKGGRNVAQLLVRHGQVHVRVRHVDVVLVAVDGQADGKRPLVVVEGLGVVLEGKVRDTNVVVRPGHRLVPLAQLSGLDRERPRKVVEGSLVVALVPLDLAQP